MRGSSFVSSGSLRGCSFVSMGIFVRGSLFVSSGSLWGEVHLWVVDHYERNFICEQWITERMFICEQWIFVGGSSSVSSGSLWDDIYLENIIYNVRLIGIYISEQKRSKKGVYIYEDCWQNTHLLDYLQGFKFYLFCLT